MDSEYKQRISLYLDKETVEKIDEAIKKYGYRSRNDFVSSAVDNLIADKLLGENDTVISEKLSRTIAETSETQTLQIAKNMFRYAVEMELIMRMFKVQIEKRIKELDNIIRCLYEDRVCGRLTPERYDIMANGYEQEQPELRQKLTSITERISEMDMRERCIRKFMDKAKSYVEIPKLTPELLRVFIRRIEVYEKPEKYSRTCGNPIVIHYAFQLPEQNGMPALENVMRPIQQTA
ncbi:hypothetical protein DPQ25_00600 [Hydrogeniiclostridium mannosilyticum]|uniref:Ribbon-helix-helix protein CopG domain-containing protein n=1 Tax=Hydrogeniiclostridium mannosilyticum TaxID=2764322 RepID=A0A328UG24_9FIRM|nr:DUF4368 domain-containing protein [Hydrogeniiclostridium mannosilyticum]RAQ30797.1 hypothetical protein DPQ25_00600 [Hydrogeniiclostridium mannosilyticum]